MFVVGWKMANSHCCSRTEFEDQLTIIIRDFKQDLMAMWDNIKLRFLCDELTDKEMRLIERLTDILSLCHKKSCLMPDEFIDELKQNCLVFLLQFCIHLYNVKFSLEPIDPFLFVFIF